MKNEFCEYCGAKLPNGDSGGGLDFIAARLGLCSEKCLKTQSRERQAETDRINVEHAKAAMQERIERDFYNSPEWIALRYRTLRKFGFRCMACGATHADGEVIQVDHIKPRSKFPELQLDEDNLQVLCRSCNIGKMNSDSIDHRGRR